MPVFYLTQALFVQTLRSLWVEVTGIVVKSLYCDADNINYDCKSFIGESKVDY